MHSFLRILATLPLVLLLAVPQALASPTLHPRLHAVSPREFEYNHHTHTHTRGPPRPTTVVSRSGKRNPVGDCNIAGQHCCNQTVSHKSSSASAIAGLLGSDLVPDGALSMGLDCSPLAPILASGGTCTGTPVCCEGTQNFNGLINMGCSPIIL